MHLPNTDAARDVTRHQEIW
uniref:Uncharacterized protein n=1 Tax=Anguilla anguilla TaxID=7936 RepID=A0A0E9QZH7_ANGAN